MMPTIMNLASRATSSLKDEFTVAMHSSLLSAVAELIVKIADDYGLDRDELTTRYIGASPDTDIASPVPSSCAENSIAGPPPLAVEKPKSAKPKSKSKAAEADRVPCAAINAKKRPCTRFAVEGGCGLCKLHARLAADGDSSSSAAPKSKKAKKNDDAAKRKSQHAPLENDPVEQAAFDAMFGEAIPLHPEGSMNDEDLERLAMELFGKQEEALAVEAVEEAGEIEAEALAEEADDDQRTVTDEEEYDLEKDLLRAFEFDNVDAAEFI